MDNQHEWGPWIEHDGTHVPDEVYGRYVGVWSRFSTGYEEYTEGRLPPREHAGWAVAKYCFLGGSSSAAPVFSYRIRQPRAMSMLKRIAALPERVDA